MPSGPTPRVEAKRSRRGNRIAAGAFERRYTPRSPEQTLIHRVVREQLETFLARSRCEDQATPRFVEQEFRAFLRCGVLAHGFLRLHCDDVPARDRRRLERLCRYVARPPLAHERLDERSDGRRPHPKLVARTQLVCPMLVHE